MDDEYVYVMPLLSPEVYRTPGLLSDTSGNMVPDATCMTIIKETALPKHRFTYFMFFFGILETYTVNIYITHYLLFKYAINSNSFFPTLIYEQSAVLNRLRSRHIAI